MSAFRRLLNDGRVLEIEPMTFGKFRICLSPREGAFFYDDSW